MIESVSVYLAGAIRDDVPEDIQWREHVISELRLLPIRFLNPLAAKRYDPGTKRWTVSGVPSSAGFITKHDRWFVKRADVVLFNFRALSQGYPNIGTLVEFGIAVGTDKLIYSIIDPDYKGHDNPAMYTLHPFLNEFSAAVFLDVDAAITFLKSHIMVISGASPRFLG
jgi:nucleoside 2-deoxyribosyltransferase